MKHSTLFDEDDGSAPGAYPDGRDGAGEWKASEERKMENAKAEEEKERQVYAALSSENPNADK